MRLKLFSFKNITFSLELPLRRKKPKPYQPTKQVRQRDEQRYRQLRRLIGQQGGTPLRKKQFKLKQ